MPATLLVVDDDTLIREMVKDSLAPQGYTFTEAKNGKDAIESLDRSRPDAVILDLLMPEQSGMDTLLKIRERAPDLPVIILSSLDTPELIQEALRAGANSFIIKPFHPMELLDAVQRLPLREKP
jgi:DNA-binding response OmpR family regulator